MSNSTTPQYDELLEAVNRRFEQLPWGSRMMAAHDLRLSPAIVSNVLNGKVNRRDLLDHLAEWSEHMTPEAIGRLQNNQASEVALVNAFVAEQLEPNVDATIPVVEAYDAYVSWMAGQNGEPTSMWRFVNVVRLKWPVVVISKERRLAGVELKGAVD